MGVIDEHHGPIRNFGDMRLPSALRAILPDPFRVENRIHVGHRFRLPL